MGKIIAVMNAKGGVGKSTTTMMVAEALATSPKKRHNILLVDADPQASLSTMALGEGRAKALQAKEHTLASLVREVMNSDGARSVPEIGRYINNGASDVRGVSTIDIIVGSIELAWIERAHHVSQALHPFAFLKQVADDYDYVLIDCSPSVTTFTERWLRSADYNIVPMRPDHLSRAGFDLICRVRHQACSDDANFAKHLGVIITMMRPLAADTTWVETLKNDRDLACFETVVSMGTKMQTASEWDSTGRTLVQKYDKFAKAGQELVEEILQRIGGR